MTTTRYASMALALLALAACQQAPQANATAAPAASFAPATSTPSDADLLARGEYMVRMSGCNDCHTPGYDQAAGDIPKERWLVGSPLGWHGPWGTTYPANLRLKAAEMDEAGWLKYTGELHTRPPMPDFNLRAMKEDDRRAIYRFIRSLGAGGQPAPAYMPPGNKPQPPYVDFVMPPGPPEAPAAAS
jgi:mono/diheme cytochrome c family protein